MSVTRGPREPREPAERGQVLVLFAVGLLVFLGFAALTVDYGFWLQDERDYQNAADSAAQAAVSELLARPITPAKRTAALQHAMTYLDEHLGLGLQAAGQLSCAAVEAGDPTGNGFGSEDCGGAYAGQDRVTIRTPVNGGDGCRTAAWGARAVTVRIGHQSTRFFSQIYQSGSVPIGVCATSAIQGGGLAIAVLKPAPVTPTVPTSANITMKLAGSNTFVRIWGGDVAINATFSAAGAPPPTSPSTPAHVKFMTAATSGISDNRMYLTIENPSPLSWDIAARQIRTEGVSPVEADDVYHAPLHLANYVQIPGWGDALYAALGDSAVTPITMRGSDAPNGSCTDPEPPFLAGIRPGKYNLIGVDVSARRWLCPGVFHFVRGSGSSGLQLASNSTIAGQGVTLVFDNNFTASGGAKISSGGVLLLNSAAAGGIVTPAPWRTGDVRHDLPMTIYIQPVAACQPVPPACSDSTSSSVFDMSGGAGMDVKGVIYGPTDNMKIAGNGTQHGAGEIWAWTIVYAGGSELDQVYEGGDDGYPLIVE